MDEIVLILQMIGEGYEPVPSEAISLNVIKHAQIQLCQISDFFMKGRVAANGH
jgi:hypothetical protein